MLAQVAAMPLEAASLTKLHKATSVADLSPSSALPSQASTPQQAPADTPGWQANPVAQTSTAASTQLPSDLQRPNLLSSSSHVQVSEHHAFYLRQYIPLPAKLHSRLVEVLPLPANPSPAILQLPCSVRCFNRQRTSRAAAATALSHAGCMF